MFIHTLGWTLIHSLWQGLLIALLLFTINLFIKRANVRYVLACIAMLFLLLIPIVTFGALRNPTPMQISEPKITILESITNIPQDTSPATLDIPTVTNLEMPNPQKELQSSPARFDFRKSISQWLPFLVAAWLLGVIVLTIRLLLQWIYAEKLKRTFARPAPQELQSMLLGLAMRLQVSKAVHLLESSKVDVPTMIGVLKPVILLPTSTLMGLSSEQLEFILAHELAHIRRHDYLVNLLQSVVEILFFYNPAVWWVSQRIRLERENCCDDMAVSVCGGNAVAYAKALERLESLRHQPQLALGVNGGDLLNRISRILKIRNETNHKPLTWLTVTILFGILAMVAIPFIKQEAIAQTDTLQANSDSGCSSIELSEYVGAECVSAIAEQLEQIKQLKTNEEKSDALIALAPELPQSGSLYSEYMQIASFLPEDVKQDTIAALSEMFHFENNDPSYSDESEDLHVHYPNSALTVVSENAVAVVEFFDYFTSMMGGEYPNGTAYRYRLLEKNSLEEKTGEGIVFDNYRQIPTDKPNEYQVVTEAGGDMLYLHLGSMVLEWSFASSSSGWIYSGAYQIDTVAKSEFDNFDLVAFLEKQLSVRQDELESEQNRGDLHDLESSNQRPTKEIRLTVVGDATINLENNTIQGDFPDNTYAILEEITESKSQAVIVNFAGITLALDGNLDSPELGLTGKIIAPNSNFDGLMYALNPIFQYNQGDVPIIKADEVRSTIEMNEFQSRFDMEFPPVLNEATEKMLHKYLELANNSLPLKGETGVLEDGTPYSILLIKDPEIFASQFSTMSAGKELRQKILEQAFSHGVIPEEEYKMLLERQSEIDDGLEYAAKNLELQFSDPNFDLNSAILDLTELFRDVNSNTSKRNSGVMVDDPNIQIPQLAQEVLTFGLSELEIQSTLLLINQIPNQKVKAETLLFIAPYVLETNNTLLLNLYGDLAMSLPEELRNTVLADVPAKQLQASVGEFDSVIALGSKNNIQVFPFTFDPKKAVEQTGITGLLEKPYQLRLEVRDTQGHREVFDEMIPAGEAITVPVGVYGQGVIEAFANNFSIYTKLIP